MHDNDVCKLFSGSGGFLEVITGGTKEGNTEESKVALVHERKSGEIFQEGCEPYPHSTSFMDVEYSGMQGRKVVIDCSQQRHRDGIRYLIELVVLEPFHSLHIKTHCIHFHLG